MPNFIGSRCPDFILQQAICSLLPSPSGVKPQHVAFLDLNPTETPDVKFGVYRANKKPKLENSSARDAWRFPVTQCLQCADLTITTRDLIVTCHSEHTHTHTTALQANTSAKKWSAKLKVTIHPYILSCNRNYTRYHLFRWNKLYNCIISPRWHFRHIYLWAPFLY